MKNTLMFIFVVVFGQCVNAAESENTHSIKRVEELFASLPGTWDGQAIETPVGSMAYAINFHPCDEDIVAGVAKTGASLHYWRFWKLDNALRLTFMSTFQGNRTPTELAVNKVEDKTVWFHAPELALLTVSMTLEAPHIDIRIFHHHKPHVYIRLVRNDKTMTEPERKTSVAMSCQKLPPYKIAPQPSSQ